jgi:hypothetical protein
MGDLGEGLTGALLGHVSVGGREGELVASEASPQEAGVVHRESVEGDRLLGGLLGGGDHRKAAHPRRLGSLPLGWAPIPPIMSPIDGSSYSPKVIECTFSEVHIHHSEYLSLSGWCYEAFSRPHG